MLKDDGLAKEIDLDKTMLLEAALEHEAEAALCSSLSKWQDFQERNRESEVERVLTLGCTYHSIISLIAKSTFYFIL